MWFLSMLRGSVFSSVVKKTCCFHYVPFLFLITLVKAVYVEKMYRLSSQIEGK